MRSTHEISPVPDAASGAKSVGRPDDGSAVGRWDRWVPLCCWLISFLTLLFIPFKIASYGYLPAGDVRRHVAKAFVDKPYSDIVVMRKEYVMDHSPGWEWLVRVVHERTGWNKEGLAGFSVVVLSTCILFGGLIWMRRPEAWMASLLIVMLPLPALITRFVQGRPYLLTEGLLIVVLFWWSRDGDRRPSWPKILVTGAGMALSAWMHGTWYLWVLPIAAFILAGERRAGFWLTGVWLAGTLIGASLTGKPWAFLKQAVDIAAVIFSEGIPQWMMVGEFRGHDGVVGCVLVVAIMLLWRRQTGPFQVFTPVFWMIVLCWILGFKTQRFWVDWGLPALLVWLAIQLEEILSVHTKRGSPERVIGAALIALALYFHSTNDREQQFSQNLHDSYLKLDGAELVGQGWMPDAGGVLYCAQMEFFYDTFYKLPSGDWRYIVGFEPALMPAEDLTIYRSIQWNQGAPKAYLPWVAKMKPVDRIAIPVVERPNIPELEWRNLAGRVWMGRLPRNTGSTQF